MGSGSWLESILMSRKKSKLRKSKPNGLTLSRESGSSASKNEAADPETVKEIAAIRIQSAFRRFKARRTLRRLRGARRLAIVSQAHPVKKQASAALVHIQSWNRIQAAIQSRRVFMVSEGQSRQRKLESRLKLEAKLNDLEVEWSGGAESLEETIARIQQREEAAAKRERAMAYAFSHQWRAKSVSNQGTFIYELGKGGWGWSWMDRWIAARPWESRCLVYPETAKKAAPKVLSRSSSDNLSPENAAHGRKHTRRSSLPLETKKQAPSASKLRPKNSAMKQPKLQTPLATNA